MFSSEELVGESLPKEAHALIKKIEATEAVIGVAGLGYVGLPLAVEFAKKGFRTIGIDVDRDRVSRLNEGHNHIQDVDDRELADVVSRGTFEAHPGFDISSEVDIFFICVPTPITVHKDPDIRYIEAVATAIAPHLRRGQLVILKSTTYPDTTEGLVQPILQREADKRDLKLGTDYFLAFSPERIDPGNQQFTTANTPVVVGGVSRACTEVARAVMQQVVGQVHTVSSPKVAEMEKLLENIFRSVNIALVNELAQLCDRMGGISMWEVVEAAATKPFGFMPFYPGPGLGGHCIPIDPYYLSWLARKYDFETNFITLSARTNEEMPFYVVEAMMRAVADQSVRLADARVLLLGVAFKRDVDDIRHSPALKIWELLEQNGFRHIDYSDPYVNTITPPHKGNQAPRASVSLSEEVIAGYDVIVAVTDHRAFPYALIAEHANRIVDTRNAFKHIPHGREKISLIGGGNF
jgi:UDP-N-acetyl-D-glucosamine dehydrogenase